MIEVNLVWIISLILIVGISLYFVISNIFIYKKENKESYSFLNKFPHELCPNNTRKKPFIGGVIVVAIMNFSILWNVLPFVKQFNTFIGLTLAISLIYVLNAFSFICINVIEAKFVRQHSLSSTLYLISSFASLMLISLFSLLMYNNSHKALSLVIAIIAGIIGIFQALVTLNPKLKDWAKLDSEVVNGEVVYSRPKKFPLAYSEWITFITSILGLILFLIAALK